jgi:RND family efflux transporter MFP subunit
MGFRMKNSRTILHYCSMLAAMAILGGCQNQQPGSTNDSKPTVEVTQPIVRPIVEYVYFTGQIQAVDSVQVRARVTGYLDKVCYYPGTVVKKDTVLFEIDPLQYQAQVDVANGKLAEANAQVMEGRAKVVQAEAQVALDESRWAIDKEVAKTSGAISKLKLAEDEATVKESAATLQASKATVLSLEASVKAAEANLQYNQLNLDWTKVRSPITGRVGRNLLTIGNLVTADATTLTDIVATDNVYVYFDVDELTLLEVQRAVREGVYHQADNVPIGVALQNEKEYPHEGLIDLVANSLSTSTGTMQVRGILKNPKKFLTPGNFVRVRLAIDKANDKLLVPDRAVIREQSDTFVLIVNGDNKVEKRKVEIGALSPTDKSLRVIEEGLKQNEWVVIKGRQHVRPGMQVDAKRVAVTEKPATSPKKTDEKK